MAVEEYPFRPTMQKVYWKDVRQDLQKISADFVKLVDEIDPGKDYPLYKASYPYGSLIVRSGVCYYPNKEGKLVTLNDPSLSQDIKKDLGYTTGLLPAGAVLQNSIELLTSAKNSIQLQNFVEPGQIFALWYYLGQSPSFHPGKVFNITSGVRSIFFLSQIGDEVYHKHLRKEFKIKKSPVKDLLSQWELFVTLLNNPLAKCDWHADLLYFSGKWLDKIKNGEKKWIYLSHYLYKAVFDRSDFFRNKIFYDLAFSRIQEERNLRPNPYVADTVKHILTIAMGALPGFAAAINNLKAPIDLLQKIFLDIYGINKYAPTMMIPTFYRPLKTCRPVYYSLALPTTLEFSPNCRKVRSTLDNLREVWHISGIYLEEMQKDYLKIDNTNFAIIAKNTGFSYHHDKFDSEECARLTKELAISDPSLVQCPLGYNNNVFPHASPFFKGCIKIFSKIG